MEIFRSRWKWRNFGIFKFQISKFTNLQISNSIVCKISNFKFPNLQISNPKIAKFQSPKFANFALILALPALLCARGIIELPEIDTPKALLGKQLFMESRLSPAARSCESCHNIVFNTSGTSHGAGALTSPPSVINSAYKSAFFYDGRVRDIRAQARESITDARQLSSNRDFVERFLAGDKFYADKFREIYGTAPTLELASDAIAEFERSLVSLGSKFDLFLQGEARLSDDEIAGFELFSRTGCIICHDGINFGENIFSFANMHNNAYQVDKSARIKVPSLRNLPKTGPYFMEASESSLSKVIDKMAKSRLHIALGAREIEQIEKFLESLDGKVYIIDEK